jgi:hypothetical protein
MVEFYRWLLYLYPPHYRQEFGDEMGCVFRRAELDIRADALPSRAQFFARELSGLLAGAVREYLRSLWEFDDWIPFRSLNMRAGFRFPRSTVFLMSVILAGVGLAIEKAKAVQLKYGAASGMSGLGAISSLALMIAVVCVAVAAGWGILFAMRRSGMHRLSNVQTWPEQQ